MRYVYWLRDDLRLDDMPVLQQALAQKPQTLDFVFVWGAPLTGTTYWRGLPRLSPWRQIFYVEALMDLARQIEALGSRLHIVEGEPQKVLPAWAAAHGVTNVFASQSLVWEERQIEKAVALALQKEGISLTLGENGGLFQEKELPFPVEMIPSTFTAFRQKIERATWTSTPIPAPARLPSSGIEGVAPEEVLRKYQLHKETYYTHPLPWQYPFVGGETACKKHLEMYLAEHLVHYKATRNELAGEFYSSRLSPYLASGCVSVRRVYKLVRDSELHEGPSPSTQHFLWELLWREYFRWLAYRYQGQFFFERGLRHKKLPWRREVDLFGLWAEGRTGYPIIDASMQELRQTGWLSNRARQYVASFLLKNLGIDWRWGAEYFEAQLIDYDPASNYGNWLYQAGIGNDPRGFRYFHPLRQTEQFDPQANYIRYWLPALRALSPQQAAMPTPAVRQKIGYPAPIVDFQQSIEKAKEIYWGTLREVPQGMRILKNLGQSK
ncbi:MAG: DASH family cryptochrome [Bacteroidia bacterium]